MSTMETPERPHINPFVEVYAANTMNLPTRRWLRTDYQNEKVLGLVEFLISRQSANGGWSPDFDPIFGQEGK